MKFSVVTPCFNSERYIEETMESVLSQEGNFEIEYIVIDGKSSDRSYKKIQAFRARVYSGSYQAKCQGISFKCLSERDAGMYDAINKGFRMATGQVFSWLNADDVYLPGAFETVSRTFRRFPEVQWVKGITSYIDESSRLYSVGECNLYDRAWIERGIYGREWYFIQQDSVFWKAGLWEKVQPIPADLKLAGDYWLWMNFAKHAELHSLNDFLSCFRTRDKQLSADIEGYRRECQAISPAAPSFKDKLDAYFFLERKLFSQCKAPACLKPLLFRLSFPRARFHLIGFDKKKNPIRKRSFYYKVVGRSA